MPEGRSVLSNVAVGSVLQPRNSVYGAGSPSSLYMNRYSGTSPSAQVALLAVRRAELFGGSVSVASIANLTPVHSACPTESMLSPSPSASTTQPVRARAATASIPATREPAPHRFHI